MTFSVANATNADVFRVLEQDTDDVINVINYLVERADNGTPADRVEPAQPKAGKKKQDDFWKYV